MIKPPTNEQKMLNRLIENADEWSYSHRVGNGEYSDKEQEQIIAAKFWKLRDKD